jgi:hypothetical protein
VARLISGCSGDSSGGPDATADQTVSCGSPLTMCSNTCVDIQADPANCGGCGKTCKTAEVCSAGQCSLTCGGGSAKCDGGCTDLLGDPSNCGGCGITCDQGHVCNDGGCALSCQTGYSQCDNDAGQGVCINEQQNDQHCGNCTTVCTNGTRCEAGTCGITCQLGLSVCSEEVDAADGSTSIERCVDTIVDTQNCGGCGNACEAGTFCSPTDDAGDASCGLGCFGGTLLCNNRCVDPKIDPFNCGGCNSACDGGQSCVNSKCQ